MVMTQISNPSGGPLGKMYWDSERGRTCRSLREGEEGKGGRACRPGEWGPTEEGDPNPAGAAAGLLGHSPCPHVSQAQPGLTLCPSPAQVLLLQAAERPSRPDNDLPVPQSTPPPWNEDFLPDAIPLAHPGPRRRPTGPAGECGRRGELGPARGSTGRSHTGLRSHTAAWHFKHLSCHLNSEASHVKVRISGFF